MKHIFLIFILLLSQPAFADTIIGVLEQPQCKNEPTAARIMFEEDKNNWIALSNRGLKNLDLNQMYWTVAFKGKEIGKVKIKNSKEVIDDQWFYRDKLFDIYSLPKGLLIENKEKEFGGWCDVPTYRPLVILSKAFVKDPEHWRTYTLTDSDKKKALFALKAAIEKMNPVYCPVNETEEEHYNFKESDVIFYDSYISSPDKKLIALGLNMGKYNCDEPIPTEWCDFWFFIRGQDIKQVGNQMTLVDKGDYNKDGKTEFLFWHSGYNNDGYILLYDSFKMKKEYIWSFH